MNENELSELIIGICIKVHTTFGPGLLEIVYEEAICLELLRIQIPFSRQQGIKVNYNGVLLDIGFRSDIIIDNKVLLEIKSVENINPVHKKVVLTYLRLTDIKLGLLINFHVNLLKEGIFRLVNNL
jgi:GxxExxY protein